MNFLIQNLKFKIKNCLPPLSNASGAVLLTVVIIIIIIGLTGVAIYSLTSTSTFTQLSAQNTTRAFYLAESGFRVVASEYNNAGGNKNDILEGLHGTTLTLPDNAGEFDIRLYPYWFYVNSAYTANNPIISLKMPGGTPLRNPADTSSTRIVLPGSGFLKLQGKTQLATITSLPAPSSPGDGAAIAYGISPGFPYDIQTDEEIFLAYTDNNTVSQNIPQDGDLDLPGTNAIAQILPARNGSLRIYNETNDKMDYTYQAKTPAVVDPGNPPTTITLSGIHHQDEGDPSIFPFAVDNTSELYFGRNLAVFSTASSGQGATAAKKAIGEYTDVGLDGGFSTGKDTISFEEDIADFTPTMLDPTPGDTSDDPIVIDTVQKTIQLGRGLTDSYGSVWYKGDSDIANCIEGNCFLGRGIRAYLEFEFDDTDTSVDSKDYGDGFSFALISSASYTDGDTGKGGEYLGYAGAGLASNGLQPPKMAVEIDTYPNPGSGDVCGGDSRRDDEPVANHTAMVYWGEETVGSLNTQGGYLRIGSATPAIDNDEDWSSPQGTISFWIRRNVIDTDSPEDRFWGQHTNMEIRTGFEQIILDWGGDSSLILNTDLFSTVDTWYFLAVTWDENQHRLRIYYGDESTTPYVVAESHPDPLNPLYWGQSISPVGILENLAMNSSGRSGERTFMVDGQMSDLRYYTAEKTDFSDYNDRLNGNESNLQSYFPLQVDLEDAGPLGITATAVGTAGLSTDMIAAFDCGTGAASYDDNRHGAGGTVTPMNSLNIPLEGGNDGYFTKVPVDPTWLEDGALHRLRMELIRPLALAEDGKVDTVYDYQIKVWIDCDGCTAGEEAQFQEVRNTFTALAPQIELTVQGSNSLELEQAVHDNLKRILFGFTQGTGGSTQNITLRNFELYFLRRYPVSDLATW
jgi:type II secretory pathway pseudopilin PulG